MKQISPPRAPPRVKTMAFDPILVLFFVLILAAPFLICSALLLGFRPFRDVWPFQSRLIVPLERQTENPTS